MTSAYRISCCDAVPADAHKTPEVIASMIADVNAAAVDCGWDGTTFTRFTSLGGILSFDVEPGERPATIEDLRQFREAEKKRRAEEAAKVVDLDEARRERAALAPEQGSLL